MGAGCLADVGRFMIQNDLLPPATSSRATGRFGEGGVSSSGPSCLEVGMQSLNSSGELRDFPSDNIDWECDGSDRLEGIHCLSQSHSR